MVAPTALPPVTPAVVRRQVVLDELDLHPDGSLAVVARRRVRGQRLRARPAARAPVGQGAPSASCAVAARVPPSHASPRTGDTWPTWPNRPASGSDDDAAGPGVDPAAGPRQGLAAHPRAARRERLRLVAGRRPHRLLGVAGSAALPGRPAGRERGPHGAPHHDRQLAHGRDRPPGLPDPPECDRRPAARPSRGGHRPGTSTSPRPPGTPTGARSSSAPTVARCATSIRGRGCGESRPTAARADEDGPQEVAALAGLIDTVSVSPDGRWLALTGTDVEGAPDWDPASLFLAPARPAAAGGPAGRPWPGPRSAHRRLDGYRPPRLVGLPADRPVLVRAAPGGPGRGHGGRPLPSVRLPLRRCHRAARRGRRGG